MKKRIISLLLAALLLLGMVPAVYAATPATVYNYLVSRVKSIGAWYNNAYSYGYYIDADDTMVYEVYHEPAAKEVELCILSSDYIVSLILPAGGASTYQGYVEYDGVASADFSVKAASYTHTSALTLKNYSGNTAVKSALAEFARDLLNYILEFTLTEIWDAGYRLKDLGFSKYAQHQIHYYDNGVVTAQPTCVSYGVKTYTCKICGKKITETVSPTGVHSWAYVSESAPTCTQQGQKLYRCTVCGATNSAQIPALGHAWVVTEVLTEPASETEHGAARYTCTRCGETKEARYCAGELFIDMPGEDMFSHIPIDWAVFNGITNGTSYNTFSPLNNCTRAQIVTFLWRAAGSPEPTATETEFTDVVEGSYYYKAVLWAVEEEITKGVSATSFGPNRNCTRAQAVTFLWRAAGCQEPREEENSFADVIADAFYYKAVQWAREQHITDGTSANSFSPDSFCTREHIVTFLYRASKIEPAQPDPGEDPVDPGEDPVDPGEDPVDPGEDPAR